MNDANINFAENRVTKKVEGTYRRNRLLFRLGQIVFILLPVIIGLSFKPLMFMLWTTPLFVWLGITLGNILFKRWLDIEYEYAIVAGEIRVDAIYGNFRRVPVVTARFRDMSVIAPYNSEKKAAADDSSIKTRYDCAVSPSSVNAHFGVFDDEKNGKSVLFFEVNEKMAEQIKRFNPAADVRYTHVDNYSDNGKGKKNK